MADLIDRDAIFPLMERKMDMQELYLPVHFIDFVINEIPSVNQWIPCSERLPEAGIPVLIYACKHRVTAYYDNCKNLFRLTENDNLYYIAEYVTYWMPIPEIPEQPEKE